MGYKRGMRLDDEACYRAFAARDRRFDGRFFTAVVTTRIYCRPGCPARLPARRNVRFYASAAAAESAGFRPCRRCRPDASPGSAAWRGTSATVARALRLLDDGALERGGLEALAGRLGVSGRWLRRLFEQQIGASPRDVVRTRRVHFARRLLEETVLPLEDVAAASGFGSARRLHDAVHATFRRSPGALRGARAAAGGAIELRLPARAPFDAGAIVRFFASRAIPGVEAVANGAYERSFRIGDARGTLAVRALDDEPGVALRVHGGATRALLPIAAGVSRLFDLDADTPAIGAALRVDPLFARRWPAAGVRVPGAWEPFEVAIRALLGQQVSVAAARTLAGRLVHACGEPLPVHATRGSVTHVFPAPAAVAGADLSALGVPRTRAEAIRGLAAAVAERRLDFAALHGLDDAVARLKELPGIGDWTAQYVAMRALGEPDAFPAGDLGVRKAIARGGRLPGERETIARAERWRPWRAYAVIALWTLIPERKETPR